MQLVVIVIGLVIAVIAIIITLKNAFSNDYEIDFEERHRGNFVNRFETNYFDFRYHID